MPPAQRSTSGGPSVSGRTTITIKNSTPYELSVFFEGPVNKKVTISPGSSQGRRSSARNVRGCRPRVAAERSPVLDVEELDDGPVGDQFYLTPGRRRPATPGRYPLPAHSINAGSAISRHGEVQRTSLRGYRPALGMMTAYGPNELDRRVHESA